jgi:hypothetical protein
MAEDQKEAISENGEEAPDPGADAKRIRARRWQIYGWSVIGLMGIAVVLNLLDLLTPDINKYLLGLIMAAYGVYIFFRRR